MGSPHGAGAGFTLVELLIVLTLLGVLAGLAVPPLTRYTDQVRLRTALDRLAVDIYHARALAAREGASVQIRIEPARRNVCLTGYTVRRTRTREVLEAVRLRAVAPGVCVTSNVGTPMTVTPRGLLSGASRTITARRARMADSILISIAGRVYRTY